MKRIITLSGRRASGKSTVARVLADRYNAPLIEMGRLADDAQLREHRRMVLPRREYHARKIYAGNADFLAREFYAYSPDVDLCVLSGIRTPQELNFLRASYGRENVFSIYIERSFLSCLFQAIRREKSPLQVWDFCVQEMVEVGWGTHDLKRMANLTIENKKGLESMILKVSKVGDGFM